MNQPTLYFFLLISLKLVAQDRELLLNGIVKSDSLPVENIHIINNRSQKGSISNSIGAFKIYVKLNDTLTISGIQFYLLTIQITEEIITNKKIDIELLQKINTLSEIELKTHDLIGNLSIDAKSYVDTIKKTNPDAINFENIDRSTPIWVKLKRYNSTDLPDTTDPMIPIGGDIIGLTFYLFKPLIEKISSDIKKKKKSKQKLKDYQENLINAPDNIREKFGDRFFVKSLNISEEQIDAFIIYCKPKGIIELFLKHKKIEMINVFLTESNNFNHNSSNHKSNQMK